MKAARGRPTKAAIDVNRCEYWDCEEAVPATHFLCLQHYQLHQDNLINKCQSCGKFKDAKYELCLPCRKKIRATPVPRTLKQAAHPSVERNTQLTDDLSDDFYVYILKLDGGEYYVGQTADLRTRIMEHRDGEVATTAGKNPSLIWFDFARSRQEALQLEEHVKHLKDANLRTFRGLILRFGDLVREVGR